MKNAIGIQVMKAPGNHDPGSSKFFGNPTVPAEWTDEFYENEIFLCQIRCRDLIKADRDNRLPHTGYLYVFLDIGSFPYEPRVLYYNGQPNTILDDFNEEIPGAEHLTEEWLMRFEETEEDAEGLRLLGIPSNWDYEETPPQVFLQYDPLSTDMGFLDHIDGLAFLLFEKEPGDWEHITYIEERS